VGVERAKPLRRILAFDSWTGGVRNIERLVPAFREQGLDLLLVHIGSWGHDPDRDDEERIGDLLVRDIRYYGTNSLEKILEQEKPAAVLLLSMQAFAHRALARYCKQRGIPTIHLFHGIIGVVNTKAGRLHPVSRSAQLQLIAHSLVRNIVHILPAYVRSLFITRASLGDWAWFLWDLWRLAMGKSRVGRGAPDTCTSACCVYTRADADYAVFRYRVPREHVHVVGNPDLAKFGVSEGDLGSCLVRRRTPKNEIIYIDTALFAVGAVFDGPQEFIEHLQSTQAKLQEHGFNLAVKLHPAHQDTGMEEKLIAARISICCADDFVPRLKQATAAIVEPSSAAIIPAVLGLPVLLACYGRLAKQEYGRVLTGYPRACRLTSLRTVRYCLGVASIHADQQVFADWLSLNLGPTPFREMPRRVAKLCSQLSGTYTSAAEHVQSKL